MSWAISWNGLLFITQHLRKRPKSGPTPLPAVGFISVLFPLPLTALPFWHLHESGSSTERPKGGRRCRSIMEIIVCRGNPAGCPDATGGLDTKWSVKLSFEFFELDYWLPPQNWRYIKDIEGSMILSPFFGSHLSRTGGFGGKLTRFAWPFVLHWSVLYCLGEQPSGLYSYPNLHIVIKFTSVKQEPAKDKLAIG